MKLPKLTKRKTATALFVLLISILAQFIIPVPKKDVAVNPPPPIKDKQPYLVTKVIDGDTIELESGLKVRYIGIDSPELHHPVKKIQCFGKEAYLKNKELVEGKKVRLEKDVSETDKYKRLLRYVYLTEQEASLEATFINDYLVKNGYAYTATFPPDVKHSELLKNSQNFARENSLGLWSKCSINK